MIKNIHEAMLDTEMIDHVITTIGHVILGIKLVTTEIIGKRIRIDIEAIIITRQIRNGVVIRTDKMERIGIKNVITVVRIQTAVIFMNSNQGNIPKRTIVVSMKNGDHQRKKNIIQTNCFSVVCQ